MTAADFDMKEDFEYVECVQTDYIGGSKEY